MTLVTYTPKPDLDGATDVLVLGVAPDGDGARLVLGHALSRRPAAALLAAAATVGATGRAGQVHVVPATAGLRASAVVLVDLGEAPSPATLREAAGAALRAATALPASSSVLVDLPAADADALEAVTEGALLGAYTFTAHKGDRRGGGAAHFVVGDDLLRERPAGLARDDAEPAEPTRAEGRRDDVLLELVVLSLRIVDKRLAQLGGAEA